MNLSAAANTSLSAKHTFDQLPAAYQHEIVQLEAFIQSQKAQLQEIENHTKNDFDDVNRRTKLLREELQPVRTSQDKEIHSIQEFLHEVKEQLDHTENAIRLYESLSGSNVAYIQQNFYLPSPYYWSVEEGLRKRLLQYQSIIAELEQFLSTQEQSSSMNTRTLQDILQHQNKFLFQLSSRVSGSHETANSVREQFSFGQRRFFNDDFDHFAKPNPSIAVPSVSYLPGVDGTGSVNSAHAPVQSSSTPGGGSLFGSKPTQVATGSAFGGTATSLFGAKPSGGAFGASTGSAFGASTGSAFGANTGSAFGANTGSAFGASTGSAFGASTGSAFGASTGSAFGASTGSAFGASTGSAFGASTGSAFGANIGSGSGGSTFGRPPSKSFGK